MDKKYMLDSEENKKYMKALCDEEVLDKYLEQTE